MTNILYKIYVLDASKLLSLYYNDRSAYTTMKDVNSSSSITLNNTTYAQPIATISIVKGASSPGITRPYHPSPMDSKGWYISYMDKQ
jgi:hypothetical protein